MANNVCIPFYEPGQDVTGKADGAAVIGKRLVKINDDQNSDGTFPVIHAVAAGRAFGVADRDAADGKTLGIVRGPGRIVPIRAVAAIDAFEEVEVGAAGQVTPLANGVAIGYAVTAALINTDAKICLYDGSGAESAFAQGAAIAAPVLDAVTAPADAPATADALRDDLVAGALADLESRTDDLETTINLLITRLEAANIIAAN